jgi:medium-chain acyl-[acyl-carrier-protein] hydrolase
MYEMKTRVGFSMVGEDLELPLSGIVNFLQDCATFHSQDTGFTTQWLVDNHRGWFVTDWQIRIHKRPVMGENVTVRTYPYKARGALASRYFTITDWDETPFVTANSLWVYMDLDSSAPTRAPEKMLKSYGIGAPPTEDFGGRKIHFDGKTETIGQVMVDQTMIDSNGHMNNGKYISIAENLLMGMGPFNFYRIEYKAQAHAGDRLLLKRGEKDGQTVVEITSTEFEPFMRLEALKEA